MLTGPSSQPASDLIVVSLYLIFNELWACSALDCPSHQGKLYCTPSYMIRSLVALALHFSAACLGHFTIDNSSAYGSLAAFLACKRVGISLTNGAGGDSQTVPLCRAQQVQKKLLSPTESKAPIRKRRLQGARCKEAKGRRGHGILASRERLCYLQ